MQKQQLATFFLASFSPCFECVFLLQAHEDPQLTDGSLEQKNSIFFLSLFIYQSVFFLLHPPSCPRIWPCTCGTLRKFLCFFYTVKYFSRKVMIPSGAEVFLLSAPHVCPRPCHHSGAPLCTYM